jgi:hypothetical protein
MSDFGDAARGIVPPAQGFAGLERGRAGRNNVGRGHLVTPARANPLQGSERDVEGRGWFSIKRTAPSAARMGLPRPTFRISAAASRRRLQANADARQPKLPERKRDGNCHLIPASSLAGADVSIASGTLTVSTSR